MGRAGLAARTRALAGAFMLAAALAAGCSHAAGPATAGPATARLADCGGGPQVRPAVVVILCADSGIVARDLRWSGWGKPVATATGTAAVNTCEYSDCFNGSYQDYPIVLAASRLTACRAGQERYGRLQYLFAGPPPFQGLPPGATSAPRALVAGGPGIVPGTAAGNCRQRSQ